MFEECNFNILAAMAAQAAVELADRIVSEARDAAQSSDAAAAAYRRDFDALASASTCVIEAIQALPPIPTHLPMTDEATRAWLKQHGFDLTKHLSWWDQPNEAGTVCRHFRQDKR